MRYLFELLVEKAKAKGFREREIWFVRETKLIDGNYLGKDMLSAETGIVLCLNIFHESGMVYYVGSYLLTSLENEYRIVTGHEITTLPTSLMSSIKGADALKLWDDLLGFGEASFNVGNGFYRATLKK